MVVLSRIFEKNIEPVLSGLMFSFTICWQASKSLFLLRLSLEILTSLIPLVMAYFSREIINTLVDIVGADTPVLKPLFVLVLTLFIIELVNVGSMKLVEILTGIHKDKTGNHLNRQMIKKCAGLDISYFDSPTYYNDMLNAQRDSSAVESMVWSITGIVKSSFQLVATGLILSNLYLLIPVAFICLNIPAIIVEKKFTLFLYNWMFNQAPEERKMSYLRSILTSRSYAKEVRLYNLFNPFFDRYKSIWKIWFTEKQRIIKKRAMWTILTSFLPKAGMLMLSVFVIVRIADKLLTIGDFSYYIGIGGQFVGSVFMLINSWSQIYDNKLRINNYKTFLSWTSNIDADNKEGIILKNKNPHIEFKNVFFKYPNTDYYILKGVSFSFGSSEKIALVGLNGAGKSTIVKLLLRFYDPTSGQLLIDGKDLKEYNLLSVRKVFGVVFQDFSNYAFSARENIAFSDFENIDDEKQIKYAAEMSNAWDYIKKWDKGFDAYLTKQFEIDGHELSGGEWQKMAIARAFFKKSQVMILDEPSANLDPEAEYHLFQHLYELCKDKGAIFISHRLSTIVMADRILVLENGEIIEAGSHQELLRQKGRYAYLFNLQAARYRILEVSK